MATFTKKVISEGSGEKVAVGRQVTVHALGQQLVDGKKVKFWSTKDAGQKPFTYAAGQKKVIAGWDDGVMTMKIGETAELTIPGQYGYGAGGFPAWGIKPNATESALQPTLYDCEQPNPKLEAWKGIDRTGTMSYKFVDIQAATTGIKAAVAAAKGETRSKPHFVALRNGVVIVATGPNYAAPSGASDSIVSQINIKGCTVRNESVGGEQKFVISQADGSKHVFKLDSATDLREWLLDVESVFKGVHAPPPERCRLLVAGDGLKVLASGSDDVLFQWPYDKIKKFQCLSERTVSVLVEVHGADVEKYFRSHDSKAREIVALITAFVKELVAQRVKSAEDSASSGGGGGGGGRRHGRSRHKSKKKSGKSTHRSRDSRSRSDSGSASRSDDNGGGNNGGAAEDSGELHPDWKPAAAPNGKVYYFHVLTKETTWTKPLAN